jgi:hypothetical protein
MKKRYRLLALMGVSGLMFSAVLQAGDFNRTSRVRGILIRLTEQKIGEQGYLGLVVKPFDSDDHITVLLPSNRKELAQTARRLEEGTRLGIAFVNEDGHNWIKGLEVEIRREEHEEGLEGEKRIIIRREARRDPGEGDERSVSRRARTSGRDPETERPRSRQEQQDRRPAAQLDRMQRQLRDVVSGHLDRMSKSVKEVIADHLWRMDAEFRELRARVDRIERQLDQLRAENERLRRQLRDRSGPSREREEQVRQPRENQVREEREIRIKRDGMRENAPSTR